MKRFLSIALIAFAALAGCRRTDLREITIDIPSLKELAADKAAYAKAQEKIASAIGKYEGVKKDSIAWSEADPAKLTVRFDSLLVAAMNLLKAIDEAGYQVVYPELVPGKAAGYIDERMPEVK